MITRDGSPPPNPEAQPLLGRAPEQAALRAALTAALTGRGSLVLIGGEAGIGKTTLAEALCQEATEQGALVLTGHCYDLSETPPYGPWRELFDRAPHGAELPTLPRAVLPPETDGEDLVGREAIVRRVQSYLTTLVSQRPTVLLLDDLHWADPASLDLLRALARNLTALPILILATYRADELTDRHPLAALLPLLVREARAARLDLLPLNEETIGTLVAARYSLAAPDLARLVRYLSARTEGNPFFLGEILRTIERVGLLHLAPISSRSARWHLGDLAHTPVPTLLQHLIGGRLAHLSEETQRLLALAAIIGQEVPLALWVAVSDRAEEDLLDVIEQASEARLLLELPDGTGVRFRHALVREAVYAGMSPTRRRAWHRRVAEAYAATRQPDPDAVAYHFQQAGDQRTLLWLIRAGVRAERAGAQITAAERFAAAAGLLEGGSGQTRERGWLLFYSGQLLLFADSARTLQLLDAAESLATLAGDRLLVAQSRLLRGMAQCHRWQLREGVAATALAVAALEELPGEDHLDALGKVALMVIEALLPERERRPIISTQASTRPPASYHWGTIANWYGWVGRYPEALTVGEAIIAKFNALPDDDPLRRDIPGRWGTAHAHAALGRPEQARREYALGRADCYARNDLYAAEYILWAELHLVVLPYQADDVAGRVRLVEEAGRVWAQTQGRSTTATHASVATLLPDLIEGRWAEARKLAQDGIATGTLGHAQGALAVLGVLARDQGEPELAWEQIRRLHPAGPATEPGDCHFAPGITLQALAAELALDAGDLPLAERWIAAHEHWLAWSGAVRWQAEHQLLRARLALAFDDLAAAYHHAEMALAHASDPRQPLALLAAHRLLGELDTAAGHQANAATHLATALTLANACAAPYERALTLLALAELQLTTGEHATATATLAEAQAILTPLNARPALARADTIAARLAAPSATTLPPSTIPFGLTAREVEVLRLVAEGLTNAQVADRLFVTPRTVNAHLTAIYTKFGVENRAAAIRLALDHGLR